jgi:hypothetical protein
MRSCHREAASSAPTRQNQFPPSTSLPTQPPALPQQTSSPPVCNNYKTSTTAFPHRVQHASTPSGASWRIRSTKFSLRSSMGTAPSPETTSCLDLLEVPNIVSPAILPSCNAAVPTPPAAALGQHSLATTADARRGGSSETRSHSSEPGLRGIQAFRNSHKINRSYVRELAVASGHNQCGDELPNGEVTHAFAKRITVPTMS